MCTGRQNCDDFKKCPSIDHVHTYVRYHFDLLMDFMNSIEKRLRTHRSTINFVLMKNCSIFYDRLQCLAWIFSQCLLCPKQCQFAHGLQELRNDRDLIILNLLFSSSIFIFQCSLNHKLWQFSDGQQIHELRNDWEFIDAIKNAHKSSHCTVLCPKMLDQCHR